MAVARDEIDGMIGGRTVHVAENSATAACRAPATKLWVRERTALRFTANDPATVLITDFAREQAWTVAEERSVDDALRDMVCAEVDSLLVVKSDVVMGLVTAAEIQGRPPRDLMEAPDDASRCDIKVAHVMIPWSHVPVLDWRSVAALRVRHIEEWLRNSRETHALLIEQLDGIQYVRGLLSRTQVERTLGRSF